MSLGEAVVCDSRADSEVDVEVPKSISKPILYIYNQLPILEALVALDFLHIERKCCYSSKKKTGFL
jgi:hypothetical protein